ncbi:hypothetical protein O6H91_12G015900 [Diphasiastrum complanatum]|uniref:Uncharacterized protein n=1 Tax=Diphasiastrum complanatum TaxID=34168 RepID=A0ACC2BZ66_DIPCM|nr:hypothetical protein O6H91_12G015900 [Diphasiastrum complanatum]
MDYLAASNTQIAEMESAELIYKCSVEGRKEVVDCNSEFCRICMEEKPATLFFNAEGCHHRFCNVCISNHAEACCRRGDLFITCPFYMICDNILTPNECSLLLSSNSLRILTTRQIEAAIPETERLYCPYPDCSSLMLKPECDISERSISYTNAVGCVECEACHRTFCMECMVPWHGDLTCAEYQDQPVTPGAFGDNKLLQLADRQNWQRCGKCARVIELMSGCNRIICLCGNQIYYRSRFA